MVRFDPPTRLQLPERGDDALAVTPNPDCNSLTASPVDGMEKSCQLRSVRSLNQPSQMPSQQNPAVQLRGPTTCYAYSPRGKTDRRFFRVATGAIHKKIYLRRMQTV